MKLGIVGGVAGGAYKTYRLLEGAKRNGAGSG